MVADFPVPRGQLPHVEVTPHERQVRSMQMERALVLAIDDFERFRTQDQSRMDAARWKLVDTQARLQLFREREAGSASGSKTLTSSVATVSAASFSASDDDSSSHGHWDDEAASIAALADGRDKHRSLRMVGDLAGRVENAVYASITKTTHEFALVQTFLHDDIADCTILNELVGPTQEEPLQFLGYKWVAKKAAGGGRLGRHRDVVYLESCGMTTTRAGEEIGYLLFESVDLPNFPAMTTRNCVRTVQSVSILLRQKSENVIEVFATGVDEPTSGKMTRQLAAQTMFALTKTMELAECKRLTKMLVSQRRARDVLLHDLKYKPTACSLCHQKRKFYNGVSLVDCSICGHVICTRCQTHKRVFIADGILGKFHRVGCCKTCVLAADRTRATTNQAPIKMSISAQLQRQNSSREFDALESYNSFSRPRSSSDSSVGELNEFTVKHGVLQTTVEEESTMPSEASRSFRGSPADITSTNRQPSRGITLLPSSSGVPQDRNLTRVASASRRSNVPTVAALVPAVRQPEAQALPRHRSGSSATGRYLLTQGHEPAPHPIRPSPSPPTFTSSAPAGTYDLRGQMGAGGYGAMPTVPQAARPAAPSGGGGASSQEDLFARMMNLRRLAESTYQTTQQNERIMQQQRTPSHATAPRPGSRF